MKLLILPAFLAGAVATSIVVTAFGAPSPLPQDPPTPGDMAAMMEKAKRFTQPGPHHEVLKRFLGKWTIETRFFMGGQATPPAAGTAEFTWLMEGRWVQSRSTGAMPMMGPLETFTLLGYDNFKQSFVGTHVSTMDTSMTHWEGDMDPSGRALIAYGTLDEYLTGEHDKMVKYVWRFPADDTLVLEVHDLPIGENHTKVVEVAYKRQK